MEALEAEAENAVRRCAERRRTGGGRSTRGAATSAGYDESHHAVVDVGGGASRDDDEDGDVEDPRILLRRQRETMDEQDDALDELSIVASRTRDVSLAVNDELDLHEIVGRRGGRGGGHERETDGGDEGGETNDAPRVELSLGVHRDGGHRVVFSHSSLDH